MPTEPLEEQRRLHEIPFTGPGRETVEIGQHRLPVAIHDHVADIGIAVDRSRRQGELQRRVLVRQIPKSLPQELDVRLGQADDQRQAVLGALERSRARKCKCRRRKLVQASDEVRNLTDRRELGTF